MVVQSMLTTLVGASSMARPISAGKAVPTIDAACAAVELFLVDDPRSFVNLMIVLARVTMPAARKSSDLVSSEADKGTGDLTFALKLREIAFHRHKRLPETGDSD